MKRRAVWWWGFGMTFDLARLLGFEELFLLVHDNPDLINRTMRFLMEGNQKRLDELETGGFSPNNDSSYVGSGGTGFSRELRAEKSAEDPVLTGSLGTL